MRMEVPELKLVVFDSNIPEDVVEQELIKSKVNGLMTIGDLDTLLAVCLVTKETIYLFDPCHARATQFISKQLNKRDPKICTVNGVLDGPLIKKYLHIKMDKQLDLADLEVQMHIRRTAISRVIYYGQREPCCTLGSVVKLVKPGASDYQLLVKKYLKCDIDLEFSNDELEALQSFPKLDPVAKMALLRCLSPLQLLAERMLADLEREKNLPTNGFINMSRADDQMREEYEGRQDNGYYQLCFYLERLLSSSEPK